MATAVKAEPKSAPAAPELTVRDLAIKVEPQIPENLDIGPRRRYWCGVRSDSKFDAIIVGGIGFLKSQGHLDSDEGKDPVFRGRRGEDLDLTDTQVKRICEAVSRGIVRTVGQGRGARAARFRMGSVAYRPDPRDEPLGRHLYMIRIEDTMPSNWRDSDPEPMVS